MKVNLGSGKNYLQGYVNVDINPLWQPDWLMDIGSVNIDVELGVCEEILAHDILEHIPDLVSAMTNCLALLKEGGTMDISVPYYLSLGAWQDPTHVRAFNEKSWLYYTDWFWYLGWKEYRFELVSLDFVLSAVGQQFKDVTPDISLGYLLTMPTAVDSMRVVLKKVALTEAEKATAEAYYARG